MRILKIKHVIFYTILIYLSFVSCKQYDFSTHIENIDNEYKFNDKKTFNYSQDSAFTNVELFYSGVKGDSIYIIGTKKHKGFIARTRGWEYNGARVGDWNYEKIYNENGNAIVTDSIMNFIVYCKRNPVNTIKKFVDNKIDPTQGYFHEIKLKRNILVNDTLIINLNIFYDTTAFDKVGREFYMFKPTTIDDYCNYSVIDSFPIVDKSSKMRFLIENKGKKRFFGYYYLRKKNSNSSSDALQVFTEINFEVK